MKFKLVKVPTGHEMEHTQSLTTTHSGDLDDDIWDFWADEILNSELMLQ